MLLNDNAKEGLQFLTRRITEEEIKTIVPSGLTLVPPKEGYYIVPIIGSIVVDSSLITEAYSDSGLFYLIQTNNISFVESVLDSLPFTEPGIYHNFSPYYTGNGMYSIERSGLELRLLCDNYGLRGRNDVQISFAYYYQKAIE